MMVQTLWGKEEVKSRVCRMCHAEKPLTSEYFGKDSGANYFTTYCKKCATEYNRNLKKLNEKYKHDRPGKDYTCPICHKGWDDLKGKGNANHKNVWCLDHDHESNTFRGWLCHPCNRGLGNLGDSIENLKRAIRYYENQGSQG